MKAKMSFFVLAVLALLALGGSASSDVPTQGLISYWTFDESSGSIAHDSVGSNHGTIYGAQWATGQIGGALEFDGADDYVNVIDIDDSLDIENSITIAAWVKLNDLSDYYFIVGKQPTGTSRTNYPGNYIFRTEQFDGYLRLLHQTGTGDYEYSKYISTSAIEAGAWHHVSVTLVEGGNVNFYVDGSPAGTVPQSGLFGLANDEPVRIGTRKDAWSYFNGTIDDVRIYDRALSAAEILVLYQQGSGPVAHWKFDEGGGTIAYDSVGTNDGTIYGAAWTTGQVGGALDFDGDGDYVEIPDDDSLTPSNQITISFWIYNRGGKQAGIYKYAGCPGEPHSPGNSTAYFMCVRDDSGKAQLRIHSSRLIYDNILSSNAVPLNEWHYIAGTFNQGNAAVYIDGQLDNSDIMSVSSIVNDVQPLMIGGFWYYCGPDTFRSTNGIIDDVRIYDRALSAVEIMELYAPVDSGPIAHFKLDEGSGSVAYDSAGTNDGTIYGAAWTTGQIGGALDFDGVDDYVEVGSTSELKLVSAGSVSAWVKPNSLYQDSIINKRGGSGGGNKNENYWLAFGQTNICGMIIGDGLDYAAAQIPIENFTLDNWYHIVGSWDSANVIIYLNGELKDIQPNTLAGVITNDLYPLRIGYDSRAGWHFDGIIDDVRIYDRALSAGEVEQLYAYGGENLLVNGNFETMELISGGWPSVYGDWSGDHAYILPRYGDIWPFQGSHMLQFSGTSAFGCSSDTASQVYQIVDANAFAGDIVAGKATASASVYFNRFTGDAQTDTEFSLDIRAFEGDPCSFPELQDLGGMHLAQESGSIFTDGDPATWQQCQVQLALPADTDYVVVGVSAIENVYNDFSWPEFDGHFADAVSLRIMVEPKVPERVYYVDGTNGDDNNDGLSPETAFATIQKGIDMAVGGDVVTVADGAYTGLGNKNLDFGGRAITVRSENGPVFTIIDCENDGRGFYFHTGEDENAAVAGFTITNGSADYGAGVRCDNSSPTINNCIFTSNSAEILGGGIHAGSSSPVVTNCTFEENRAGEHAGGMCCTHSNALVSGCVFIANSCYNYSADGGAMWNAGETSATIVNCLFVGNTAIESGGAIRNDRSSPTIINCTFNGNSTQYGGAICNAPYASPIITNCIFWGNSASLGDEIDNNGDCHPTISYCDIDGGWNGPKVVNRQGSSVIDGGGNIDDVPCFADPNSGDYHLKSQAGRWDPNSQSWVQDDVTSLCIDAGVPMSPIGDEPFPNGGIINMGACGGTAEASKSYFGQPVCEVVVAGDINGDCKVNFLDFRLMTLHWLEDNTSPLN